MKNKSYTEGKVNRVVTEIDNQEQSITDISACLSTVSDDALSKDRKEDDDFNPIKAEEMDLSKVYEVDRFGNNSGVQIGNAKFLAGVFRNIPDGVYPAVCIKKGYPENTTWPAKRADRYMDQLSEETNNYFNCSTFKLGADGSFKALKDRFAACHCLMLDDVGTKVSFDRIGDFKLSWVIETSPGNHQAGIIFDTPLTNYEEAAQLLNCIIDAGLCDSGSRGVNRWVRTPVAINGKTEHRSETGDPFQCRLVKWEPEARYTVDQIREGLKLNVPIVQTDKVCLRHTQKSSAIHRGVGLDTIEELLNSLDPDGSRDDWVRVLMAVHYETGGSDDGFALVNQWSSKGRKFKGINDVKAQWRSFSDSPPKPVKIGTLIKMARDAGADIASIMQYGIKGFKLCETVVIAPSTKFDGGSL